MTSPSLKYALFLKRPETVLGTDLVRAFSLCSQPKLTPVDAAYILSHGYGVVAKDLIKEEAISLCQALETEGIPCDLVSESWLALGSPISIGDFSLETSGLIFQDDHFKFVRVDWARFSVLGTGVIRREQLKQATLRSSYSPFGGFKSQQIFSGESENTHVLSIQLIAEDPLQVLRLEALVKKQKSIRGTLRQIQIRAPKIYLSSGTNDFVEGAEYLTEYQTARQFELHLGWLRWKHHLSKSNQQYKSGARRLEISSQIEKETFAPILPPIKPKPTKEIAELLPTHDRPHPISIPPHFENQIEQDIKTQQNENRIISTHLLFLLVLFSLGLLALCLWGIRNNSLLGGISLYGLFSFPLVAYFIFRIKDHLFISLESFYGFNKSIIYLIFSLSLFYYVFIKSPPYPAVILENPPEFSTLQETQEWSKDIYKIAGVSNFRAKALVLKREKYRWDELADLAPVALLIGWGPMAISRNLKHLSFWQSHRSYRYEWKREIQLKPEEIRKNLIQIHLIPQDPILLRQLLRVRQGDVISVEGVVVNLSTVSGWNWTSTDSSKIIWVKSLVIDQK